MVINELDNSLYVAHVLTDHETCVAGLYLFVVDQVSELVASPVSIVNISEVVLLAHEHCNRDVDLVQVNGWREGSSVVQGVFLHGWIGIQVHAILLEHLAVVDKASDTGRLWPVTHVLFETHWVVQMVVLGDHKVLTNVAGDWQVLTERTEEELE